MKENSVGIVVLARYSSSRLPGKALMSIAGKPSLGYIFEKIFSIVDRSKVILATSQEPSDDPIEKWAKSEGIQVYRGSLENVAQRFYEAGKALACDYICRINGDNILLDLAVLDRCLGIARKGNYDFISNVKDRTYPKGMSVEIAKTTYYASLLPEINQNKYWSEHVMIRLYELAEKDHHAYVYNEEAPEAGGLQFSLDTKTDFERTEWLISHMKISHVHYGLKEILPLFKEYEQSV